MDLNYLLRRHQISLMRAKTAASPEARCAHAGLARGYRGLVTDMQRATGAGMTLPAPIRAPATPSAPKKETA